MRRTISGLAAAAIVLLATDARTPATAADLTSAESGQLDQSYALVSSEFYKKVEAQTLLDGARPGLEAYLKRQGVATPNVPAPHATATRAGDQRELERVVRSTVAGYGKKVAPRELSYAAIAGMLQSVHDRYTVFLTPKEYASLNEGLDGGNFSGVGIAIHVDDKTKLLTVNDVIPAGPAEKAGLQPGDVIISVDGKSTKGLTTEDDAKLLRGKRGTLVRVAIERSGKMLAAPVALTREIIHQPSVYAKLLDGGIGYARLTVFGLNTGTELGDALAKLQAQGAKAYVLDLRDNGGGYLNAAIDVSSKFISSGPIVSVESRSGNDTRYDAQNTAIPARPLAVLVNRYTASASEITSGAIADDGAGTLIGEKTFGKGVVQTIHPLPDGSAVKITTARYLTPNGHDINLVGIQPAIVAVEPKGARLGDPRTDVQLQTAITFLQGKIAQATAQSVPTP